MYITMPSKGKAKWNNDYYVANADDIAYNIFPIET